MSPWIGIVTSPKACIMAVSWYLCLEQVAAGCMHSCAVNCDGELTTWGWSSYGQCGHGSTCDTPNPTVVTSLGGLHVNIVAAGLAHTVVCTGNLRVFSHNYQLGVL